MELKGKTAVVTGSTKGIGKAIATALVRDEVNVIVSSRESREIELTIAELNKIGRGRVAGSVCDVRDYAQVGKLFETAVNTFGGVDILVNNAGIGIFASVEEMSPEDFSGGPRDERSRRLSLLPLRNPADEGTRWWLYYQHLFTCRSERSSSYGCLQRVEVWA